MAASRVQRILGALLFYGRFSLSFTEIGYRWRRVGWPPFKPDFAGQHWLVTGASGGLGRELALSALAAGATVTAVARSQVKLEALRAGLSLDALERLHLECCDFTRLSDTEALLQRQAASARAVDVLINNVGVLNLACEVTREGYEASFVSNLLSHYHLTEGLIARGLLGAGGLVINMTSGGAYAVPLRISALNELNAERYSGVLAYASHKRAQIVLTDHWRKAHAARGVTFYATHPGWVDTQGVQRSLPVFRKLYRPLLRSARSGVDTALWLAAERPPQAMEPCVWFDRKARTAHAFSMTRDGDADAALVDYLRILTTTGQEAPPAKRA